MTKKNILSLIKEDEWMMKVLEAAEELDLPDWMIGAGFVRNKVWDHLHGFSNEKVDTGDVDLIFYDPDNLDESIEKEYDRKLKEKFDAKWSTKNSARMHLVDDIDQYKSTEDALAHWVETATCVAVKLENGELKLIAPHGIDDLVNLIVRPSPYFFDKLEVFKNRVEGKNWLDKWPKLKVVIEEK